MVLLLPFLIAGFVSTSYGYVPFKDSILFEETDFALAGKVNVTNFCTNSCRLYVSVPEKCIEFADAIIVDDFQNKQISLYQVSLMKNGRQKGYLTVKNAARIYFDSYAGYAMPIAAWLVRDSAMDFNTAEVYDGISTYRAPGTPASTITIFNANPYVLTTLTQGPMTNVAIAAGYDAFNDIDQCTRVLKQTNHSSYQDFKIWIRNPLITLYFDYTTYDSFLRIWAQPEDVSNLDLSRPAFVTSPGYTGCALGDSRMQVTALNGRASKVYRSSLYSPLSIDYTIRNDEVYALELVTDLYLDIAHAMSLYVRNDDGIYNQTLFGSKELTNDQQILDLSAKELTVTWRMYEMKTDYYFMIRVEPLGRIPRTTTTTTQPPTTTTTTQPTTTSTSRTSTTATTPVKTTASTAPVETTDNYCNCGIKDGWFDGWRSKDIWVDVVILLDVSTSMGKSLEEAKSMIMAFVSLLSTDTNAEFYTRVGVIAVANTVEVIYNLTMSSTDNLYMVEQHNIAQIDISLGIQAAQSMFANGMSMPSYRQNA